MKFRKLRESGVMKKALTIAGSDSGGCAGIQADIKTMSACGVFATSVITAVTAQNTLGVRHVEELSVKSVEAQLDAVMSDIGADSVKSGMLFSEKIITAVAAKIDFYGVRRFVLDPVMISSSGSELLEPSALNALKNRLLPLAAVVTPNVPEAEKLAGFPIPGKEEAAKACETIKALGPEYVLIKGGHFEGNGSDDILFDGVSFKEYASLRINTKNVHGTGCTFASALAAFLARDFSVEDAVERAKKYVTSAISAGTNMKIGNGPGPVNHFFAFEKEF